MAATWIQQEPALAIKAFEKTSTGCLIGQLRRGEEEEVLTFLSTRPIHTVFMSSMIRDNGLASSNNRGSFYGCRNEAGALEGVGLLGHATLVETRNDSALIELARLARNYRPHLIRGEQGMVERFWQYFAHPHQQPRTVCREVLMEQREVKPALERVPDLRTATIGDLDKVLSVNSSMVFEEAGVSPLEKDPMGFRDRTSRRIAQGRVWVWIKNDRLIFKADVVAETPQANYVEGVHVHHEERRKGYGLRCMNQLSTELLSHTQSICLTINEQNEKAVRFYARVGYQFSMPYQTIYLNDQA